MDFTKLEGTVFKRKDKLTPQNKELRLSLYIQFANTRSLSQLFSSIFNRFEEYIKENLLQRNHNGDILYSFFIENKCGSKMKEIDRIELNVQELSHPLFPIIHVSKSLKHSHQVTTKSNNIGYQHLYMWSNMTDSSESSNSNTSDSDLGSWDAEPLKKKLKTCQRAIEVDCNAMLQCYDNATEITGIMVHVDILIFIDKSVCKKLSEYLGLIYVEDLLIEAEENDMHSVLRRLNNKSAKLYRLIQSYINKKLIAGYNNICLVHTLPLWENFKANVRGVISIENNEVFYAQATETANFCVELGENPLLMDHVEAVAIIINKALSYETHVIAKYQCDEDSYCAIKLPLISIVPLYVLRYFTQCKIKEQNHGLLKCDKL